MRGSRRLVFSLAFVVPLANCGVDLKTVQFQNGVPLPPSALPYALSKTSVTLNSSYVLSKCDPAKGIAFTTTSTLTTAVTADDSMRFYIDYGAMQSALKDTNVTLDLYSNGTLKDIDTSGTNQVLQTAVAGLGAVLSGAIAIAPLAGAPLEGPPAPSCTPPAMEALSALDSAKTDQKNSQAKLDSDTKALNAANVAGETAAAKTLQAQVQADTAAVADATDKVAKATASLTIVTTQTFTPLQSDFVTVSSLLSCAKDPKASCPTDADVKKLETLSGLKGPANNDGVFEAGQEFTLPYAIDFKPLKNQWFTDAGWSVFQSSPDGNAKLAVTIAGPLSGSPANLAFSNDPTKPIKGLPVRLPVSAHLHICRIYPPVGGTQINECDPSLATVVHTQGATSLDVLLPQLGSPVILTLQGSPVQLSKLTVTMNSDGSISNITTADSSTATQIFNSLSSAFTTATTQENSVIQAKATALTAQNGAVTANANLLTAQNGTATANAAVLTAQNGTTSANAAVLTAQNGTTSANASMLTAQTSATAAQVQAQDNALKSQVDCIAQLKTIVQSGNIPVVQCP